MGLETRTWRRSGNARIDFTALGLGTAPLGNLYRAIRDDEAHAVLERAWGGRGSATTTRLPSTASGSRSGASAPSFATRTGTGTSSPPRRDGSSRHATPTSERASTRGSRFRRAARYTPTATTESCAASSSPSNGSAWTGWTSSTCTTSTPRTTGRRQRSTPRIDEFMASGYRAMVALREQGTVKAHRGRG